MQAYADALPLAVDRAGEPSWQQAVARSAQAPSAVSEFDKPEIGRDAYRLRHSYGSPGVMAVAVSSVWLGFCAIAAVHSVSPQGGVSGFSAMADSNAHKKPGMLADALIKYAIRDYPRSVELLTPLARQGDAVAQLKLGEMYAAGEGVAPDETEAVQWFGRAAKQGHVEAQYQFGIAALEGRGRPRNSTQGLHWLRQAAKGGAPHALNALGEYYLNAESIALRHAQAIVYFRHAARMGDAKASYNLAALYAAGTSVAQNLVEALKWFELSADVSLGFERDLAQRAYAELRERVSPIEVADARRLAEEWRREIEVGSVDDINAERLH